MSTKPQLIPRKFSLLHNRVFHAIQIIEIQQKNILMCLINRLNKWKKMN